MDVLTSALILYGFAAVICGLYVFRDRIGFGSQNNATKPVGPSYWGVYNGASTSDRDNEKTIKLHALPTDENGEVVGSHNYSSGKAIKSARS